MGLSTTIPSIAIEKLIPILQSQLTKLIDITSLIEISINSLPVDIKCSDPVVKDIKQQLENVSKIIANINKIKSTINKLTNTFNIVAGIAQTVELIQLAIPAVIGVPQGPFAKLAIIANILGKNCKSAGSCLASILISIDLAISKLESVLAFAITKLSTICINETFVVSSTVRNEILGLTEQSKSTSNGDNGKGSGTYGDIYKSNFYNEYNVSDEDLDALESIVDELNELELNLNDYILEAPAAVYTGTVPPAGDLGKIGDFYINLSNQTIYGPKTTDSEWIGSPIKY